MRKGRKRVEASSWRWLENADLRSPRIMNRFFAARFFWIVAVEVILLDWLGPNQVNYEGIFQGRATRGALPCFCENER
jgi:hypothetical protein